MISRLPPLKKLLSDTYWLDVKDAGQENYRIFLALNYIGYVGIIAHALFIPLFYLVHVYPLAILNIFSTLAWVTGFIYNRTGKILFAFSLIAAEVVIHAFTAVFYLGWESGFHYYLIPLVSFIFFNHLQKVQHIIIEAILLLIGYLLIYNYTHQPDYHALISPGTAKLFFYLNTTVNFAAICIIGYYFRLASVLSEKQMERLATTDVLTHLYNRRKMNELLEMEKTRFIREPKKFVIALADIDNFKIFNDQMGHDCGDYVLKQVSGLMKQSLRDQDMIARWGGEEFLVLLPDTDIDGGNLAIEKLRQHIAQHELTFNDTSFNVTLSFGLAVFDGTATIENCIKHADQALYTAKREGRNRVISTT